MRADAAKTKDGRIMGGAAAEEARAQRKLERAEEKERMQQRPDETFYEFSKRIGAETAAALDEMRQRWVHHAPDSVYSKRRAKRQRYEAERAERMHARGDADRHDHEDAFAGLRDDVAFGETVQAPPRLRATPRKKKVAAAAATKAAAADPSAPRPQIPEQLTETQRAVRALYRQKKQRDRGSQRSGSSSGGGGGGGARRPSDDRDGAGGDRDG